MDLTAMEPGAGKRKRGNRHEMQKGMRFLSKIPETGGSTANMQFISYDKPPLYPIAANEMYFCASTAQKQKFAEIQMHFCI
ncbi:MAG: hypothetical protein E6Z15_07345 [Paenibacillus macerans]|nr:hypothetical protein [Paenibacillus macerans]